MNKRSGHKRSGHKRSRRTAKKAHKKERRGTRGYRKGSKSKTMKGKKDFTTKKTSKVFNRRKHYQKHAKGSRVNRRPYAKKGGATTHNKHTDSVHHGSKPSEVSSKVAQPKVVQNVHSAALIAIPSNSEGYYEGCAGLACGMGQGSACHRQQNGETQCIPNSLS